MPTGKVKWFDAEKGFGFLSQEDGPDVYVRTDALPEGTTTLKPGTRVEFGIAQGRRGDQALQVRILDAPASVSRNQRQAQRKKPEEMVPIVEDLIRLLDGVGEAYRHGRHPDARTAAGRSPSCCARWPTSSRAEAALDAPCERPAALRSGRRRGGADGRRPSRRRRTAAPGALTSTKTAHAARQAQATASPSTG